MDNKVLIEQLKKIPELKLNSICNEQVNGECITRNPKSRRKNVIGNIHPNRRSFLLYSDGQWVSKNKIGIRTVEEAIIWVKKDIANLSRQERV